MDLSLEESKDVNAVGGAFSVHLDNFDGPFDLLLQLISRHKMDITEISLSLVTDEFIAFIRALEASGEGWRLDQATEFLVVAATLLDLKAARLLPSGEVDDEEDLACLKPATFSLPVCCSTELSKRLPQPLASASQRPISSSHVLSHWIQP